MAAGRRISPFWAGASRVGSRGAQPGRGGPAPSSRQPDPPALAISARPAAPHPTVVVASCSVHRLTKAQARRIAVRAQLLDAPRPTDLLAVVQQLTLLQIDPTAAIAPSADLVAWSRLGSAYQPGSTSRRRSRRTARCSSSTRWCGRWATSACTSPARPTGRSYERIARLAPRQRPLPARHPQAARAAPGR